MTTLDGNAIFGDAVNVIHNPRPNAQQINHFFGIDGQQTLFGGTRGRSFVISGVLSGSSMTTLNAVEATLLSYADGLTHTLVDNRGRIWPNVIFRGEYAPSPTGPRPLAGGQNDRARAHPFCHVFCSFALTPPSEPASTSVRQMSRPVLEASASAPSG